MITYDNAPWVLLAFILVAFLALHFGLEARRMSNKVRRLETEIQHLKASGSRGGRSSPVCHEAALASFIFGMILGGSLGTTGDGHDPDLSDGENGGADDYDVATADGSTTTSPGDI